MAVGGRNLSPLIGCMATSRGGERESAVLIRQVTTWRLARIGLKSLTAFHDLTKAFGPVKWEAMDRAVASLLGPNALIGQLRYRIGDYNASRKRQRHHTQDW